MRNPFVLLYALAAAAFSQIKADAVAEARANGIGYTKPRNRFASRSRTPGKCGVAFFEKNGRRYRMPHSAPQVSVRLPGGSYIFHPLSVWERVKDNAYPVGTRIEHINGFGQVTRRVVVRQLGGV